MKEELYGTRLYINCSQLEENINYIKQTINKAEIIAMVKANAYGFGDIFIAKKMEQLGINYFGVADFEEGVRLRNNGVKSPIMVMNTAKSSIQMIINNKLEPVIYSKEILAWIIHKNEHRVITQKKPPCPIHIKINTGMNRWGFNLTEIPELIKTLKCYPKHIIVKSLYSHFSSADNRNDDIFTEKQKAKITFQLQINTHINIF